MASGIQDLPQNDTTLAASKAPQGHQLDLVAELLLQRFGLWQWEDKSVLDIDSTGLMVK